MRHTAVSFTESVSDDLFGTKEHVGHADIRTTVDMHSKLLAEGEHGTAQNLNGRLENVHEVRT